MRLRPGGESLGMSTARNVQVWPEPFKSQAQAQFLQQAGGGEKSHASKHANSACAFVPAIEFCGCPGVGHKICMYACAPIYKTA